MKKFWGASFECGEQGHGKERCPTIGEGDKKANGQLHKSNSAAAPYAFASAGVMLGFPASASSSVAQGSASGTRLSVAGKPAVSYRGIFLGTQ